MSRGAVLVTRPAERADGLSAMLRQRGWTPIVVPTVATAPVTPGGALDDALRRLGGMDWVVVTSAVGVECIVEASERLRIPLRPGGPPRWAAVGPATADALARAGLQPSLVAERASGSGLADALAAAGPLAGRRILLPRADAADPGLPARLSAAGALVDEVVAYRTIEGPGSSRAPLHAALARDDLVAALVASGSAVRGLLALVAGDDGAGVRLADLALVTIGPSTSEVVLRLGLTVAAEAAEPTAEALVEALERAVTAPDSDAAADAVGSTTSGAQRPTSPGAGPAPTSLRSSGGPG